jgi:hypothetical protein
MNENFVRQKPEVLTLILSVILCVKHPWMKWNIAFWQNYLVSLIFFGLCTFYRIL